jgi:nicotinic acid mononucleotide adenylyltransferase
MAALSALEEFDEIRVLPVYQHTFSTKRNTLASYEHRIALCQRAFADIPHVTVSKEEQQCFDMLAQGM